MAQVHAINGTTINYINHAAWTQPSNSRSLSVLNVFNRWQAHRWLSDVVPMSEWEVLAALRGSIASITTTDPADRNADYVTYYGVVVQAVEGRHEGRNMVNVSLDFLVRP